MKAVLASFQHFEAAGVVLKQGLFALNQVQSGAFLGACLGEDERPGGKIKGRQAHLAGPIAAALMANAAELLEKEFLGRRK